MSTLTDHWFNDRAVVTVDGETALTQETVDKIANIKKAILGTIVKKNNNTEVIDDYKILLDKAEQVVKTDIAVDGPIIQISDETIFYGLLHYSLKLLKDSAERSTAHKIAAEHKMKVLYQVFADDYELKSHYRINYAHSFSQEVIYGYLQYRYSIIRGVALEACEIYSSSSNIPISIQANLFKCSDKADTVPIDGVFESFYYLEHNIPCTCATSDYYDTNCRFLSIVATNTTGPNVDPILQITGLFTNSVHGGIIGHGIVSTVSDGLSILSDNDTNIMDGLANAIISIYSNTNYIISKLENKFSYSSLKNMKMKLFYIDTLSDLENNRMIEDYCEATAEKINDMCLVLKIIWGSNMDLAIEKIREKTILEHSELTGIDEMNDTIYNMIKEKILLINMEDNNK